MRRAFVVATLGLAPALASNGGCSSGSDASTVTDAAVDAAAERPLDDASEPEAGPPPPTYNTEGWLGLDFGGCPFFAAPSPDKLPAPIEWEPCASPGSLPAGLSCRQIKVTWPPPTDVSAPYSMAFIDSAWVDRARDRVLIAASRFTGNRSFRIVGEADGPMHAALVEPLGGSCSLGSDVSVYDGRVVYTASIHSSTSSGPVPLRYGAIGGGIDEVPRVLRDLPDGIGRTYIAGANAFLEWGGGFTLRSWTDGSLLASLSLTDPGDPGEPGFQGDALYFGIADLDYARIKIDTPAAGLQDLVSYGNDVSHNANDLGTDGVDMTWVEGIGRSQGGIGQRFSTYDIMTAPYTTNAATAQAQKRRLRSEAGGLFRGAPFVVGCGFAAHEFGYELEAGVQQGTRVVRLSDGVSWRLIDDDARGWARPVAITCSEVFVNTFYVGTGYNLARVRLDSLGPGDPPD